MSSVVIILTIICGLILFCVLPFTVMGIIAFCKTKEGAAKTFSYIFARANFLMILTVILVVVVILIFGLTDKIKENSISAILSGIVGYVLGSYKRKNVDIIRIFSRTR